jgi:hypothetical protein
VPGAGPRLSGGSAGGALRRALWLSPLARAGDALIAALAAGLAGTAARLLLLAAAVRRTCGRRTRALGAATFFDLMCLVPGFLPAIASS